MEQVERLTARYPFVAPAEAVDEESGAKMETQVTNPNVYKPSFYKPELDILRFFAFLSVYVVHTWKFTADNLVQHDHVPLWLAKTAVGIAHGGDYGVDVFFVLSAYLITELLLREKEAMGSLDVRAFYMRRILRIFPLYYLFVCLAALIPFLNPQHEFSLRYVIPFLFFMGNWSFVAFGFPHSVAVPLWSVSVEEQFYLLWPPVVARLTRRQIVVAAIAMILVANVSRFLALLMHQSTQQLWANTFAHLDSIGAGILVASVLRGKVSLHYASRIALVIFGFLCLSVRASFVAIRPDERLFLLGTLIGYPAVVLACTAILVSFLGMTFRSRVLEYLGKISYGLYVYHFMCIAITRAILPAVHGPIQNALLIILSLGMTIAVSAVSYAVVEKPFLNLKRRFTYVDSRPA